MAEDEQEEKELAEMWGTITEVKTYGVTLQLDDGDATLIPRFYTELWGHDIATLKVGTRLRCAVEIEWKPTYFVRAVLNAVHEGGKRESGRKRAGSRQKRAR